MSIEEIGLG